MDVSCRKSRLKQLLDMGSDLRKNNKREDSDIIQTITNIIKENDNMNRMGDVQEIAHNTTEVVMDAQVVQMSHELIGEVMHKMGTSEFVDEEWINAIIAIVYKNDNENWDPIAEIGGEICKMVKFSPCFLASYNFKGDIADKVIKERQSRKKGNKGEEVRPESLSQIEQREGNTHNILYKEILRIFLENKQEPIPYYKLIIDPHNFMNSVDNAFQVAFLARDKSVKIWKGDDELPLIRPLSKSEKLNAPIETVQAICSLDVTLINKMIKKYKIKEALLTKN